jgi:sugar phosphate isomerase/epimerase
MKTLSALTLVFTAALSAPLAGVVAAPAPEARIELGVQAWTFRRFTLLETLDKAQALGFRIVQAYPGQALGGGRDDTFHHDMKPEARAAVLAWAKQRGIAIVSYGVVNGRDEAEWRKIFDFAKAMGIRTVAIEPPAEEVPMIEKIARKAGVRIALHNHPTPTRYADPAVALATVKPFGPDVGLCADTGHWMRSGHDPVASLQSAAGRLIEVHFKDLNEAVKEARDVPWGTGISNAAGQIAELRRQGFRGNVFVEYEYDTPELEKSVALCAAFFRRALTADLATLTSGQMIPPGYTRDVAALWRGKAGAGSARWPKAEPLFDAELKNAEFKEGTWAWEDGVLVAKGGGDIWTKESYGDFVLSLEFRCEAGSNSGVFIRSSDIVEWLHNSIEVQILQGDAENPRHVVGSIFDVLAPMRQLPIEPGTWHRFVITAQGAKIEVMLDDEKIVTMDLEQWTKPGMNPDETPNKFQKAYRDMAREGRIGLQYHGNPIAFRNLLIERL